MRSICAVLLAWLVLLNCQHATAGTSATTSLTYTPPWAGSQTIPQANENQNFISALEFPNIDFTGATDSTAGLQVAANAASAAGRPLLVCGKFKISAAIAFTTSAGVASGLVGCSEGGATFVLTNATQDGISFSGTGYNLTSCLVRNITLQASTVDFKTAGAAIHLSGTSRCRVFHNQIISMFDGIRLDSTALSVIEDNSITGGSLNGVGIRVTGSDVNSFLIRNYSDNPSNHEPSIGVLITDSVNGSYIEENSFSHYTIGASLSPTSGGKVQNIFFVQNAWDLSGSAGALFDSTSAPIYRIFLVNEWYAATTNGPGVLMQGASGMSNIQFDSAQVRDNGSYGVFMSGTMRDIVFDGLVSTANNELNGTTNYPGVSIGANVNHVTFVGGRVGPTAEEFNYQSYAFLIASGADYIDIHDVDVTGNTISSIVNGAVNSTHNKIHDNGGYNPIGSSTVVVGVSPWTYTAGASPETLYVQAGTCVSPYVQQGTTAINAQCAGSYQLGSNESITFNFSVAPVANRMIH